MKPSFILVVDDEPDNFDVIEALLLDLDYELYYASSGQEAIASLDTFQPDLILLDVMMPKMDGIEVCQRIKNIEQWKAVPVIMVTALNTKADLARCLQVGADDFISKPVNSLELRARVNSMLRIKQQHDRIQSFTKLQRNTINLLSNNLQELRKNLTFSPPIELNAPLQDLVKIAQRLKDEIEGIDHEPIHQLLDSLCQSVGRVENLTQRFLNYLYLELSIASLQEETDDIFIINGVSIINDINLSFLLKNFAQAIADRMKRSQDLVYAVEDAQLTLSHKHLQWIVEELLDNAFKFSQPKTPVTVRGECREGLFHLSVKDLGQGMTHKQIASISALLTVERQNNPSQGTGLGLKIVQKVVELYGGRFRISSIYAQETTVYITLPLANADLQKLT